MGGPTNWQVWRRGGWQCIHWLNSNQHNLFLGGGFEMVEKIRLKGYFWFLVEMLIQICPTGFFREAPRSLESKSKFINCPSILWFAGVYNTDAFGGFFFFFFFFFLRRDGHGSLVRSPGFRSHMSALGIHLPWYSCQVDHERCVLCGLRICSRVMVLLVEGFLLFLRQHHSHTWADMDT